MFFANYNIQKRVTLKKNNGADQPSDPITCIKFHLLKLTKFCFCPLPPNSSARQRVRGSSAVP